MTQAKPTLLRCTWKKWLAIKGKIYLYLNHISSDRLLIVNTETYKFSQ